MRLWRLSGRRFARRFDGGYGLLFDGRWNSVGRAVTYAATSPSLCVLQKLVHVEDPTLLPEVAMVAYDVPDDLSVTTYSLEDLPVGWGRNEALTQRLGDGWLASRVAPLLFVPSVIVPIAGSLDRNVLINHAHPASARIAIAHVEPFRLDVRLLGG